MSNTRDRKRQSQSEMWGSALTDHSVKENHVIDWESAKIRVGSEYFKSTRVLVLSTSEVLKYEYEYFSPFCKSTRVRVQSTQNVLMNTLMSTSSC